MRLQMLEYVWWWGEGGGGLSKCWWESRRSSPAGGLGFEKHTQSNSGLFPSTKCAASCGIFTLKYVPPRSVAAWHSADCQWQKYNWWQRARPQLSSFEIWATYIMIHCPVGPQLSSYLRCIWDLLFSRYLDEFVLVSTICIKSVFGIWYWYCIQSDKMLIFYC